MTEMQALTTDQNAVELGKAMKDVADEFEGIMADVTQLQGELETSGWSGLEDVRMACERLNEVRIPLGEVGTKVEEAGQVLTDRFAQNQMVGEKETVTEHRN